MNVLVICVDTLRWDHVGYAKQFPVSTPNIDRLAQRATIFERAYIGSFPTNPMRTDSITGNCNFPRYDWKALGDEEIILSEVLNEAGYYTSLIVDHGPMKGLSRGFQEFYTTHNPPDDAPESEDIPFLVPKEHIRQEGKQRQQQMADLAHCKYDSEFWVGTSMTKAAEWLQDNYKRDKWFLWVDTFEPHEVWHTPHYYVDRYDPNYKGLDYDFPCYDYSEDIYSNKQLKHMWAHYAASVTMTDRWIGHLLTQMDVMQLWNNTMVVLISDHGTYIGEHKRAGKHPINREDPWPLYEEVAHIPLVVYSPKKDLKKRVKALAQPSDVMPTLLDACRVKGPNMHGKSLLPLMNGKKRRNFDVVFSSKHGNYKTRRGVGATYLTATSEKWSYIAAEPGHRSELYDLKADPKQKRNLAKQYPGVCKKMQDSVVGFLRQEGADSDYIARFE